MRITVNREKLMTKLQQRLHDITDGHKAAKQAREDYEQKAEAVARKEALKALRDPECKLGRLYFDEKGRVSISVNVETGAFLEPVKRPDNPQISEIEVLRKSLRFFEMGTDETVVVTDKDPYYRYIR